MAEIITYRPSTPAIAAPSSDGGLGGVFSLLAKQMLDPNAALRAEMLTAQQNKNRIALQTERALAGGLDNVDYNGLGLGAALGEVKPKGIGELLLTRNANTFGYKDPRTTNAIIGSGGDYKTSYQGTQDQLQNARTIQAMQEATKLNVNDALPVNVVDPETGMPVIRRRVDAIGMRPVINHSEMQGTLLGKNFDNLPAMPPAQQKALGAEPTADKLMNWAVRGPDGTVQSGRTLDGGKTDAGTGQPLPQGAMLVSPLNAGGANSMIQPPGNLSAGVSDKLVLARDNNAQVVDLATRMRDMVQKNGTIVGASGNAQRITQDLFDTGNGVAQLFGSQEEFQKQFEQARRDLAARGMAGIPGVTFNSDASNIVKLNTILKYKVASALAGQNGRDLSDKDMKQADAIVGNPAGWLQGPTDYLKGLENVIREAGNNRARIDQQLNSNNIRGGQAAPQPAPVAQEAAQTPQVERWERGPDGQLRKVQ